MRRSIPTPLQAKKFDRDVLIDRAFQRVARVIHEWQEESPEFCPTNVLRSPLIADEYVLKGESTSGTAAYGEHVVPCILLCNEAIRMILHDYASIDQVATFLRKFLHIVRITREEQQRLDAEFKERMPTGWTFQNGDPYDRLKALNIKWIPYER